MHTAWARAEGVPYEMKNFRGICEIGSLIGAVEDVDMKMLRELGIVRFKAHVKRIRKVSCVQEFSIPPEFYDIKFSVEAVIAKGTLNDKDEGGAGKRVADTGVPEPLDPDIRSPKKKRDAAGGVGSKESGPSVVPPEQKQVPVAQQNSVADVQNEECNVADSHVDGLDSSEERVHFSQEEDLPDSQDSFQEKVDGVMDTIMNKKHLATDGGQISTVEGNARDLGDSKNKQPLTRKSDRLKSQEDEDINALAMKRAALKNDIAGNTERAKAKKN